MVTITQIERAQKAATLARQAMASAQAAQVRTRLAAEVRAFLADVRPIFRVCGDAWSYEGARRSGVLPDVQRRTQAFADRLHAVTMGELTAARRRAYLRGALMQAVTQAHLGNGTEGAQRESGSISVANRTITLEATDPIAEPVVTTFAVRRTARVVILEPDGRFWVHDPEDEPYRMLPGGGVEDGETFQVAAVREALEETGLVIELVRYVCDFGDQHAFRRYYVARRVGGAVASTDEDGGGKVRVYLSDEPAVLTSEFDRLAVEMVRSHAAREADSYFKDCPRNEKGWCEPGGGSGQGTAYDPGVKLSKVSGRVFTGKPTPTRQKMSKPEVGAIGERVAVQYLRSAGMLDAQPLNLDRNNFPVDLIQDHELIEVKAGQVSNGPSAQQWRLTIGEPGKAEKAAQRRMSAAQLARVNSRKQRDIVRRKESVLRKLEKEFGRKLKTATITMIVNPDTRTADIYKFQGWHQRIGWNSEEARRAYVGTVRYSER